MNDSFSGTFRTHVLPWARPMMLLSGAFGVTSTSKITLQVLDSLLQAGTEHAETRAAIGKQVTSAPLDKLPVQIASCK
jgi:hypothetical protein